MLTTYALYIYIQSIMVKCATYMGDPTFLYTGCMVHDEKDKDEEQVMEQE